MFGEGGGGVPLKRVFLDSKGVYTGDIWGVGFGVSQIRDIPPIVENQMEKKGHEK